MILVLVILVIIVAITVTFFGRGFANIGCNLDNYDKDQLPDCQDSCPCVSGAIENKGCPAGYKITGTDQGIEDKSCLKKKP